MLRRDRVGVIFQAFNLVPSLTAWQKVILPSSLARRRPEPSRVRELLHRVGLAGREGHRPAQLSGGRQQRVAIARALLGRPEVLFADEPTGALDRRTGHEVLALLREAFDYPHREIAEILDITEAAGQQIFHRAKKHLADGKARTEIDEAAARRIVEEFLAAATNGRIEPLVRLLTENAISIGDGGGKVPARARAFEGAVEVAKFLRGLAKPGKAKRAMVGGAPEVYAWTANGDPAVVAVVDGRVIGVMCLEVTAEGIAALRNQANPDKLERATAHWAAADHGEPLFNVF